MERLRFKHLYDDVWAAFQGQKGRFFNRKIIFPQGFQPVEGQVCECNIVPTCTGTFVYNNEESDLCFAELANAANIIEIMDHKEKTQLDSPLAVALVKAGIVKAEGAT